MITGSTTPVTYFLLTSLLTLQTLSQPLLPTLTNETSRTLPPAPAVSRRFTYSLISYDTSMPLTDYTPFITTQLTEVNQGVGLFGRDHAYDHDNYFASTEEGSLIDLWKHTDGNRPFTWGLLADLFADMVSESGGWKALVRGGVVPGMRVMVFDVLEGGGEVQAASGSVGKRRSGVEREGEREVGGVGVN